MPPINPDNTLAAISQLIPGITDGQAPQTDASGVPTIISDAIKSMGGGDTSNSFDATKPPEPDKVADSGVPPVLAAAANTTQTKIPTPSSAVPDPLMAAVKSQADTQASPDAAVPATIKSALDPSEISDLTQPDGGNLDGQTPELHEPLGHKIMRLLPEAIKVAGVIGGGMEAAGSPGHEAPNAAMFEHSLEAQANRNLEAKKMGIEQQRADTDEEYRRNLQGQYQQVPVQDPNDPSKTIMVLAKDVGKYSGVQATNNSREAIQGSKDKAAYQRELLKQGNPMIVDPELAQVAGQPDLAGKPLAGVALQNFIKVLGAKGIHIQDLGTEGLWSVDKLGNRIKQVSVSSPSLARAVAGRQAGVTDVFDEQGNLTPMTDAERLQRGLPKAQTEFGEQGPTSDMRNKAANAARATQAGTRVLSYLQDPAIRAQIGPVMGKAANFEDFLGVLPPDLAPIATDLKSFAQFMGGLHPVRGLNALEAFEKYIGGIGQNPATLAAKIGAQMKTADFVNNQGKFTPNRPNGGAPSTAPATSAKKGDPLGIL